LIDGHRYDSSLDDSSSAESFDVKLSDIYTPHKDMDKKFGDCTPSVDNSSDLLDSMDKGDVIDKLIMNIKKK